MDLNKKQPVIVITGPTASGKTALGIALAKEYGGEVISADSMQVYKGLDITTAKPTESEMQGIPHHLISVIDMDMEFSVADYVKIARKKIEEIASRGKIPLIVGGTGLYINSLIDGIDFGNAVTGGEVRKRLIHEAGVLGALKMHEKLKESDPDAASAIPANNIPRVLRALEVLEVTGIKFSEYKKQNKPEESPYNACMLGLNYLNRQDLYDKINERTDIMMENGMLQECEQIYRNERLGTVFQAIGYKELIPYFEGRDNMDVCVDRIKQNTRRYAKRQLTWFRRDDRICWVNLGNVIVFDKIIDTCKKTVAKSEII